MKSVKVNHKKKKNVHRISIVVLWDDTWSSSSIGLQWRNIRSKFEVLIEFESPKLPFSIKFWFWQNFRYLHRALNRDQTRPWLRFKYRPCKPRKECRRRSVISLPCTIGVSCLPLKSTGPRKPLTFIAITSSFRPEEPLQRTYITQIFQLDFSSWLLKKTFNTCLSQIFGNASKNLTSKFK